MAIYAQIEEFYRGFYQNNNAMAMICSIIWIWAYYLVKKKMGVVFLFIFPLAKP